MDDRLARLEARLEELTASVRGLEARLDGGAVVPAPAQATASAGDMARPAASEDSWASALQQLGKSLLILGGAFLIRALTDGGTLPRGLGIGLGLGYAVAWIALADRAGARGRLLAASFFGATAIFIACPLALEAATRFGALTPAAAAALLAGFSWLALSVAWRRDLSALAWIATLASLFALFAFMLTAYAVAPVCAALLALGAATAGLAYSRRRWHGLRWPIAVASDLVVVLMTWLVSRQGGIPEAYRSLSPSAAFWLALALPVVYAGSAAVRTLIRRRDVTAFEAAQSVASLLVGLGGAQAVARASEFGRSWLGIAGLVLSAACYGVAFAFVERRSETSRNFHFYATLALLLALFASGLVLPGGPLSALWSALGVGSALLGARLKRATLRSHAGVYLAAGAAASSLIASVRTAFLGPPSASAPALSAWAAAALVACAASYLLLAPVAGSGEPWHRRLSALLALDLALAGIGTLAVGLASGLAGIGQDAGALDATRTGVLSASALGLAAAWRRTRLPELHWTAWVVLVACGAKILVQDVPDGRPATLVAALAVYGLALTFAPRWLRRG